MKLFVAIVTPRDHVQSLLNEYEFMELFALG